MSLLFQAFATVFLRETPLQPVEWFPVASVHGSTVFEVLAVEKVLTAPVILNLRNFGTKRVTTNKTRRARDTPSQKILVLYRSKRMFLRIFWYYIDSCRGPSLSKATLNFLLSHESQVVGPEKSLTWLDPWKNDCFNGSFNLEFILASALVALQALALFVCSFSKF